MDCIDPSAVVQQSFSATVQVSAFQQFLSDEEIETIARQLGHVWRCRGLPGLGTPPRRHDQMAAFLLALAGVLDHCPDVILKFRCPPLAILADLGDNRIVPHGYSPINSSGVQMIGAS